MKTELVAIGCDKHNMPEEQMAQQMNAEIAASRAARREAEAKKAEKFAGKRLDQVLHEIGNEKNGIKPVWHHKRKKR